MRPEICSVLELSFRKLTFSLFILSFFLFLSFSFVFPSCCLLFHKEKSTGIERRRRRRKRKGEIEKEKSHSSDEPLSLNGLPLFSFHFALFFVFFLFSSSPSSFLSWEEVIFSLLSLDVFLSSNFFSWYLISLSVANKHNQDIVV